MLRNASIPLGSGETSSVDRRVLVRWLPILPALLYALIVYPFIYRNVVGEPDLERMLMAMVYGATTGLKEAAGFHYDLRVSFGYYAIFYHLLPHSVLLNASSLIAAINGLGFGSAVLSLAFLGLYASRLFGMRVAFLAGMLFGLSPEFLELGTSGHPQLPALALWLVGAWLLTFVADGERGRWGRTACGVGAFAITVAALTVRADVALAFPFVTLAGRKEELHSLRHWLRASGLRVGILAAAFAVFLGIQMHWYAGTSDNAGYVSDFFATYYRLGRLPRGIVVLVLATGIATMACAAVMAFLPAARRLPAVHGLAIGMLALPSLAFWLPNSTPARHLIFASLAVALFVAVVLARHLRAAAHLAAAALLLPLANQAFAEATHGLIARNYPWQYPQLAWRRTTDSVPIGAFPPDHDAKQREYSLLRGEGRAFAQACTGHVLVFAEEPRYMLTSLIEVDRATRLTKLQEGPFRVIRAAGGRCTADFVEKKAIWHRDVMAQFLASGRDPGWPIYFQEARRNPSDRTRVPAQRRFCLDTPLDRGCVPGSAPR